jgi:hypothetical protein
MKKKQTRRVDCRWMVALLSLSWCDFFFFFNTCRYLLSQQTDLLSKEIKKIHEERTLAHFATKAENQRRLREAEESGRRQAEAVVRQAAEARFQVFMEVVQSSTENFLDQIFTASMATAADKQASVVTTVQTEVLNPMSDRIEHAAAATADPSMVVNDLLSSLVLPEVEREMTRRKRTGGWAGFIFFLLFRAFFFFFFPYLVVAVVFSSFVFV